MTDEYLRTSDRPGLRRPVLLTAFSGWNDASQAATYALVTLKNAWDSTRFAEIDPEVFFDFTETRPAVSLTGEGQRALEWPRNAFYAQALPEADHDVILFIGTEPQLRWRTFCRQIIDLARSHDASVLISLGALLADVPHTMPPTVSGFATTAEMLPRMKELGIGLSSYEGPTGIVGALHESWSESGVPAMSLWAHVPHYISAAPNPHASLALLQRVQTILNVPLPIHALEPQADAFRTRIDEALVDNPEAQEYVRQLEQHLASEAGPQDAPELIEELEQYLRSLRPDEPEG